VSSEQSSFFSFLHCSVLPPANKRNVPCSVPVRYISNKASTDVRYRAMASLNILRTLFKFPTSISISIFTSLSYPSSSPSPPPLYPRHRRVGGLILAAATGVFFFIGPSAGSQCPFLSYSPLICVVLPCLVLAAFSLNLASYPYLPSPLLPACC
jgi:hypothetical protein